MRPKTDRRTLHRPQTNNIPRFSWGLKTKIAETYTFHRSSIPTYMIKEFSQCFSTPFYLHYNSIIT